MTRKFLGTVSIALLLDVIFGIVYNFFAHHYELIYQANVVGPVLHLLTFGIYVFAVIQIIRYYFYKRFFGSFVFSIMLFLSGLIIFLIPLVLPIIGGMSGITKYIGIIRLYNNYVGVLYGLSLVLYGAKKDKLLMTSGIIQLAMIVVDSVVFHYEYFINDGDLHIVTGEYTTYVILLSLILVYLNIKKDQLEVANTNNELLDKFD